MKLRSLSMTTVCLTVISGAVLAAPPAEVAVPGERIFPESMIATKNGTFYFGSIGHGEIFRAKPGAATAEIFIAPNDKLQSATGVNVDEKTNTLYVCSQDFGFGITTPAAKGPPALTAFDLKTGAYKASYVFPGGTGFCNDTAIGKDGAVYVTDSRNPRILRLKPGATALEVWLENPIFGPTGFNLDGIAFGPDGNLYVTGFSAGKLFRVNVGKGMSAGDVTELHISQPLGQPDGFRPIAGAKGIQFLLAENAGKLDRVTITGDDAKIETLKDGLPLTAGVAQVGKTAYVLESHINYIFNPKLKDQTPPPFRAVAVPLTK